MYGDGSDGDLLLDPINEATCIAYGSSGNVYESLLDGACVWSTSPNTCTCTLEPNSRWGDNYDNTLVTTSTGGTILDLKNLKVNTLTVLKIHDPDKNNPNAAGGQAWIRVRRNADIVGKITGNGIGANGKVYTGAADAANTGPAAGCSTFMSIGGAAGSASAAGGQAKGAFYSVDSLCGGNQIAVGTKGYCTADFFVNSTFDLSMNVQLFGAAGGKGGGGTALTCKNLNGTLPTYSLGAPGGGGGKCLGSANMDTLPGRGGGGLYISVGKDYTLTGSIELKGGAGTQGGGGGGGGTMLLRVKGTRTDSGGTYDFSGGAGGAACALTGSSGSTAGGGGGKGVLAILQ